MVKRFLSIIVIFSAIIFSSITCFAQKDTLYIGILPYHSIEKIWYLYADFIDYLKKTTGIHWELKLYNNYETIIEDICINKISIAYLGPNPLAIAYEKCKIQPLAVSLGPDGKPYYQSVIFTGNPDIKSIKDIKGKKFAFGDKTSTSSHIIPRKMLRDDGITIEMITPIFLKNHDNILNAVLKNDVDAGATKAALFEKVRNMKLKALKISEPIPHHAFCASPNIELKIKSKFTDALLRLKPLHNYKDKDIVRHWDPEIRYGFIKPPKVYIQEIMKLHMLFKEIQ